MISTWFREADFKKQKISEKISPYCQDTKRPDVLIQPQPLIADDASHGQPQAQHEPVQREDRVQAEPLEDHSSTTGLPPAPAQDQPPPASPPSPASVQPPLGTPDSPPVVRRSTRERVEPQRLNVESWKGTYIAFLFRRFPYGQLIRDIFPLLKGI